MPKRSNNVRTDGDIDQIKKDINDPSLIQSPPDAGAASGSFPESPTERTDKNPHAVALGRLGGKKGGPARAAKLTAEQLSAIGRKGARARWGKRKRRLR
jgi:hypothetical protein